ncbi:MAG: MAPEG family protein [Pseudomonadota bacterium]
MPIPITGLYVGLTIILAIVLGMRIGMLRGKTRISILDGGNTEVALRMRHHGNLVETAALTLFAMGVIELNGASAILLHGLGLAYITSRILHPIGLKADDVTHPLRAIGAGISTLVMLIAGLTALWQFYGAVSAS